MVSALRLGGPVTGEVVGKTKTAALHWYLRPLIEDEGVKEQLKYGTMGKQQNVSKLFCLFKNHVGEMLVRLLVKPRLLQ